MEKVSRKTGTLSVRGTAAIEGLPFEVLEQILSDLPRSERLAASRYSPIVKDHNEQFNLKFFYVEIGESPDLTHRTKQSKFLLQNSSHLYDRLSKDRHPCEYTGKISIKISRCFTYEKVIAMRLLKYLPSLQELSLLPPPFNFELPVAPPSLHLNLYYDRSSI